MPEARALLLLRCNVLAKGYSGIRPQTLQLAHRDAQPRRHPGGPRARQRRRLGDLAPLAHLALVLIGEGEAFSTASAAGARGARRARACSRSCSRPRRAWPSSTAPRRCARWVRSRCSRAEALAELADVAGAMTLEGLLGSHRPFLDRSTACAPTRARSRWPSTCAKLLAGSAIVESHADCAKVQDPYSLRCMPQVHGAARDALAFARRRARDRGEQRHRQPARLRRRGRASSPAATSTASRSRWPSTCWPSPAPSSRRSAERRVEQLVNPALSGLPPFLAKNSGLNSGFMIAQVTSAALVAESRVLAHPACVDSIPSSAGREDHVSMGMTAALKARQVVELTRTCLAIELLGQPRRSTSGSRSGPGRRRRGPRRRPSGRPLDGGGPASTATSRRSPRSSTPGCSWPPRTPHHRPPERGSAGR